MHRLFETSTPAFSYMTEGSKEVLNYCEQQFKKFQDGPIVTMDAGANVHLLFRPDQSAKLEQYQKEFEKKFKVLRSPEPK